MMDRMDQAGPGRKQAAAVRFLQIPFVERLIYYLLIPDLFARLVFEPLLNYPDNLLLQKKLWIFYGLLMVDYIFQIRRVLYSRVYIDKSMYASVFLLFIMLHGILVGIGWQNNPAKVATDTIPLFIAAINILLACQLDAYKNFNYNRVETMNIIFAIIMVTVSIVAVRAGRPLKISLGGAESTTVSMAIIATSFWKRRTFGVKFLVINSFILVLIVPYINRTTLALILIIAIVLFFTNIIKSPLKLYVSILLIGCVFVFASLLVPPDSPLGRRIHGLNSENLEQQQKSGTGSIGDRDEEWAQIQKKISKGGQVAKIFGFGHGAVYDVVIDGVASVDYSNAHYGWALFDLRYGYCGFFYLFIFTSLIVANIFRKINSTDNFNRVVLVTCIGAILYIFTYMSLNILLAGLQFMHRRSCPAKKLTRR